jgi:hypothetical protein
MDAPQLTPHSCTSLLSMRRLTPPVAVLLVAAAAVAVAAPAPAIIAANSRAPSVSVTLPEVQVPPGAGEGAEGSGRPCVTKLQHSATAHSALTQRRLCTSPQIQTHRRPPTLPRPPRNAARPNPPLAPAPLAGRQTVGIPFAAKLALQYGLQGPAQGTGPLASQLYYRVKDGASVVKGGSIDAVDKAGYLVQTAEIGGLKLAHSGGAGVWRVGLRQGAQREPRICLCEHLLELNPACPA